MISEIKILFDNIKDFRKLNLNEAVDNNRIVDAINNHKIIYIYYAGDDTILKGYRTIRPFVLGTHEKTGNKVLRAWQDAGSSDSYRGLNRTPRWGHEKISGPKGIQPGWRLFLLDKITSAIPTGEEFNPSEFFDVGDVKYNPNDKDMSSIEASIEISKAADVRTKGLKSIDDPDVTATKIDKSTFDPQASKFKQFFSAARKTRQATKEEIETLWNLVKTYRKKSPRNYWVVQNEKNDMVLKTKRGLEIDNIPSEAVVGNLKDLYNKFVLPNKQVPSDFFNKVKNNTLNQMKK